VLIFKFGVQAEVVELNVVVIAIIKELGELQDHMHHYQFQHLQDVFIL
jgi:hypothetical protein